VATIAYNSNHTNMTIARVSGGVSEEVYDPKIPAEKQKVTYQAKDGTLKTVTKAELQDQMETSEKLMQSLNETWEDKMMRTQEIQKEREQALEELGITVEKNNIGVHTPKKVSSTSISACAITHQTIRCLTW
jgi:kinesin family protein 1